MAFGGGVARQGVRGSRAASRVWVFKLRFEEFRVYLMESSCGLGMWRRRGNYDVNLGWFGDLMPA